MSWMRYVTGWAQVRIRGAAPERFLSALAERGISFWEAKPPRDFQMTVKIPLRAAKLTIPLAEAIGCEAEILCRKGLPAVLFRARHRWMLLGGGFFLAVVLAVSGMFIWQIDVEGCERVSEAEVRYALAECGVDIGKSWVGLRQDLLRNSMILKIPEIRWMTVSIRGSRAEVIVRESRTGPEPVAEEEYVGIVAEKAGLITSVEPLRGTAVTAENRTVLPGETLIAGYITGRYAVQGATRAIGEVWARTWYERTAAAPVDIALSVPTGEKQTKWALILGKIRINFFKGSSICPDGCDKIIYVYPFAKEGVFALPLTLEKTEFTAYETEVLRAEELRAELEAQLMEELLADIGPSGTVTQYVFTASEEEGLLRVTLRAECHEPIGTEQPLTEEELLEIQSKIPKTEETDT